MATPANVINGIGAATKIFDATKGMMEKIGLKKTSAEIDQEFEAEVQRVVAESMRDAGKESPIGKFMTQNRGVQFSNLDPDTLQGTFGTKLPDGFKAFLKQGQDLTANFRTNLQAIDVTNKDILSEIANVTNEYEGALKQWLSVGRSLFKDSLENSDDVFNNLQQQNQDAIKLFTDKVSYLKEAKQLNQESYDSSTKALLETVTGGIAIGIGAATLPTGIPLIIGGVISLLKGMKDFLDGMDKKSESNFLIRKSAGLLDNPNEEYTSKWQTFKQEMNKFVNKAADLVVGHKPDEDERQRARTSPFSTRFKRG